MTSPDAELLGLIDGAIDIVEADGATLGAAVAGVDVDPGELQAAIRMTVAADSAMVRSFTKSISLSVVCVPTCR
jgi:hypothetical protein